MPLPRITARQAAGILLPVLTVSLAGCAGSPSPLNPASLNASLISKLTLTVFGIAAVVFLIVEGMLIYSAIRFSRKNAGPPSQTEGNRNLEIAWTFAPAIVLVIVYVISLGTLRTVGYLPASAASSDPTGNSSATTNATTLHVRVVGHQWWWEFDYPDLGITTANEMHVPVGVDVTVDVESVDVIHSYWVPELGGKIDVIPGHVNHTWFNASQTGVFHGQCAEFCGVEHGDMRFDVVVETADQFQAWVKAQQAPVASVSGAAAQGEQVFMNGACIGCHTINGTNAKGLTGPNLTHFASRSVFAGATLQNTPENVAKWLADPQAVKPGNLMPNLHLSQTQINQLVAFLESLK